MPTQQLSGRTTWTFHPGQCMPRYRRTLVKTWALRSKYTHQTLCLHHKAMAKITLEHCPNNRSSRTRTAFRPALKYFLVGNPLMIGIILPTCHIDELPRKPSDPHHKSSIQIRNRADMSRRPSNLSRRKISSPCAIIIKLLRRLR